MSLLDSFLLEFVTDGLDEVPQSAKNASGGLDKLEESAKKSEEAVKKLDDTLGASISNIKKIATQAAKTIAPFILLGKAIGETANFASQAVEIADAALKAGMTIEEFQALDGNKYALFTREDVNNARDYEMTMRDLRLGMSSIGANISRLLLPGLTAIAKVAKVVVDFFTQHGTFIKLMFIGIAAAITIATIPAIINMGVALWTALSPIIVPLGIIIGLITAIALVIEDLIVWVNGGESAFADLWNEIFGGVEGAKKLFDELISVFRELWNVAKPILEGLLDIILKGIFNALKGVVKVLAAVVKGIKALTGKSVNVDVNKNVNGSHAEGLDYVPFDGYIAELHKGERVQTASEANDWRSGLIAAKKAINFTASYPLNSIPTGAVSNAYNSNTANKTINIGDITIQTQATDAQGIATDLAGAIKRAVISLDDGMLA